MIGNSNIFMPKSLHVAALLAAVAMLWPAATPPANASTTLQGTYWDADNRTCGNTNSCQLQFAAVPVGKTLLVRRVGCLFQLPSTAKISHARLQRLNVVSTVNGLRDTGSGTADVQRQRLQALLFQCRDAPRRPQRRETGGISQSPGDGCQYPDAMHPSRRDYAVSVAAARHLRRDASIPRAELAAHAPRVEQRLHVPGDAETRAVAAVSLRQ